MGHSKSNRVKNRWKKKSIEIANSDFYLDKLQKIYGVESDGSREIDEELKEKARSAYNKKDYEELVRVFLKFDKFPINDTNVGFLRNGGDDIIEKNSRTVKKIGRKIEKMGFNEAIRRSEKEKVGNRRMGNKFEDWVLDLKYKSKSKQEFKEFSPSKGEVVIFDGSGKEIKEYIEKTYDCKITKEPDLLAKKNKGRKSRHIAAEAKNLTGFGGHQSRQLDGALSFVSELNKTGMHSIAIIDGVPLLEKPNRKFCRKVRETDQIVISALLLEDYLDNW